MYFAAFNLTNAVNYAYLAGMGLLLTTEEYGLFVALFGVIYLLSALGNTVQVTTATHIARVRALQGGVSTRDLVAVTVPVAVFTGGLVAVFVAIGPLLSSWFNTSGEPVVWASVAAGLSVLVPCSYGILQGIQRFVPLGVSQLVMAGARAFIGFALVGAGLGPTGALAGVALGYIPSGLLALAAIRQDARSRTERVPASLSLKSLTVTLVASIAIAAPTSLDVALANHFLSEIEAGAYAAMAVIGRVILFFPLAISFLILPKVAAEAALGRDKLSTLTTALAATTLLAIGSAVVLLGLAHLGWTPIGNDIEIALGALPWYLFAMIAFTMTVPAIYYRLGKGETAFLFFLLPGILAQAIAVILFHQSLTLLAQALLVVNLSLAIAMLTPWLRLYLVPTPNRPAWRFE